jgi:hypothetical protein
MYIHSRLVQVPWIHGVTGLGSPTALGGLNCGGIGLGLVLAMVMALDQWYSTFLVRIPPDIISLQLCIIKVFGV